MKKIPVFIFICLIIYSGSHAQSVTAPPVDKSPMDMSYYPANYPVLKIQDKNTEPLIARVIYSRPQKAGRVIFNELVKNGEVWRLGANEATEIDFYKHVNIGGKKVAKGRYTLYAIPNTGKWTVILNKETDTWGAFKYDAKKNLVLVDVPVQKTDISTEYFSMYFEKTGTGCNLIITWDTTAVKLPVIF
jgi:hypothetical protein